MRTGGASRYPIGQEDYPRHDEWQKECRILGSAAPPFIKWLADQRSQSRIRGDNPPIENFLTYDHLVNQFPWVSETCVGLSGLVIGVPVVCELAGARFPYEQIVALALAAVGLLITAVKTQNPNARRAQECLIPIALDDCVTEFTAPLADRSTLNITVHFQIPSYLNVSVPGLYGGQARIVEQLNQVTKVKLIKYVQQFTEPPSRLAIEDHLNRELVQFQDENNVAVLRVEVPAAIHVHPTSASEIQDTPEQTIEQEPKPMPTAPKIRGHNPPPTDEEQRSLFIKELDQLNNNHQLKIALAAVPIFLLFITSGFWFIVVVITVITLCSNIPTELRKHTTKREDIIARARLKDLEFKDGDFFQTVVQLDAYNTEFTAPLADRSTLRITAHFQVPRKLNIAPTTGYGQPIGDPHFVEQLNRVTEAKLITYVQQFTDPPSRLAIEDHLNRELVRFQDENQVPVLRVEVPIAIHVHPDKPVHVNV